MSSHVRIMLLAMLSVTFGFSLYYVKRVMFPRVNNEPEFIEFPDTEYKN